MATRKYADTLLPFLGERLLFPADFAGRGDMSRGALLLHSVATNKELRYLPISRARQIDHCRNPKKIGFMMGVGVCATLISFVWQYFLSSIGKNLARSRGTNTIRNLALFAFTYFGHRPPDGNVFLRARSRPGKLFRAPPVPCLCRHLQRRIR